MHRLLIALSVLALFFPASKVQAQSGNLVVAVCGTLPLAYKPGATQVPTQDVNGNQCIAGSFSQTGGTISNATSGQATSGTNQGSVAYNYGFNGTTWDQLQVDASKFLKVNCSVGCAGGTASNASSGVATSATNGQSVAWMYGFNGATWDQLQVDATKNLKITGSGTAGTSATGVLTVQGIAAMTPILVNPGTAANFGIATSTQNSASPSNGQLSLAQFNTTPTAITSGNTSPLQLDNAGNLLVNIKVGGGGGGGGAVTIASGAVASGAYASGSIASGALAAGSGVDGWDVAEGARADAACGSDNGTCSLIALQKRGNQNLTTINTSVNAAIPAGTAVIGFTSIDPCNGNTPKINKAISQAASAVLVAGVSAKKTYICSLSLIAAAAEVFNLVEGTGSTCGTGTTAVMGSTTTAQGLSLAANGGLTLGSGVSAVAFSATNTDDLCMTQSGSSRLSGNITYVQQ